LRIHTTNDNIGTRSSLECRARTRGLANLARYPSQLPCRSHSQLDINVVIGTRFSRRPVARSSVAKPMPSRHRFLEPIHNVKEGEDLPIYRSLGAVTLVFIPGKDECLAHRCAVSRGKAAPYGAARPRWPCLPPVQFS